LIDAACEVAYNQDDEQRQMNNLKASQKDGKKEEPID
jgi:hypothetical protein